MSTTALDALTRDVQEYEAIRDNLPPGPEAEVRRLLASTVIAAGYTLIELRRGLAAQQTDQAAQQTDQAAHRSAQERWKFWEKMYDDLQRVHLAAEYPHGGTAGDAAVGSSQKRQKTATGEGARFPAAANAGARAERIKAALQLRDNAKGELEAAERKLEAAKGELERKLETAKHEFVTAKREYQDYVRSAASGVQPTSELGVFSALVADRHPGFSEHRSTWAPFHYTFHRDPRPVPLVRMFQAECLQNPRVASGRFELTNDAASAREDAFVDREVKHLGPRLQLVAKEVLGLRNLHLSKLHTNSGVDTCITTDDGDDGQTALYLPIEVKRLLRVGPRQTQEEQTETDPNFIDNFAVLSDFCLRDGNGNGGNGNGSYFHPTMLWYAFTQAAAYMQYGTPRSSYAVVLAKNAVFLLRLVARTLVLVSDAIAYTSTDPHPVAVIMYWVAAMKRHPCAPRPAPSPRPVQPSGQASRDPINTRYGSSRHDSGQSGGTMQSLSRRVGQTRIGSNPPGGAGAGGAAGGSRGPRSDDYGHGQGQQHKAWCDTASGGSGHSTMVDAEEAGDMGRRLEHSLLDVDSLVRLYAYRCPVFEGTWGRTQRAIVKAAPVDDSKRAAEIRHEVAIYRRLRLLQGLDIPRLLGYGTMRIDGKEHAAMVIERIEDRDMPAGMALDAVRPINLDKRPALKALTDGERAACMNALGRIHRLGVVHGDLRGANVLFRDDRRGKQRTPVLIDFGFAKTARGPAGKDGRREDYNRLLDVFEARSIYG